MARKLGRKSHPIVITEQDCLDVYAAFIGIQEGRVSLKEVCDTLSEHFHVSVPTLYKLFSNIKTMKFLLDHNVDMAILEELDKDLKALNLIRLAQQKMDIK